MEQRFCTPNEPAELWRLEVSSTESGKLKLAFQVQLQGGTACRKLECQIGR